MTKYIAILAALIVAYFLLFARGPDGVAPVSSTEKGPEGKPVKLVGRYHCPTPEVAAKRLNHEGGFVFLRLDWSIDRIPAKYTGGLRFSQAVFVKSRNELSCNYEWPNQASDRTWIVVTGHLIPNAALGVIPRGKRWHKEGSSLICTHKTVSGCTFDLQRKKRV